MSFVMGADLLAVASLLLTDTGCTAAGVELQ